MSSSMQSSHPPSAAAAAAAAAANATELGPGSSPTTASSSNATSSNTNYSFSVRTPGRICLFGEHQDYLHLPVIATTTSVMNLFCQLDVTVTVTTTANVTTTGEEEEEEEEGKTGGGATTTLKDSGGKNDGIGEGEGDDDVGPHLLLPVIYLERSTEKETGKDDDDATTTATTTTTTVFDLNKPLPPSPPPPSSNIENSSSSSSTTTKPDFALSVLHEIFKLISIASSQTTPGDSTSVDQGDDELQTQLGPLWKFQRSTRGIKVKCFARSPPPRSGVGAPPVQQSQSQQLLLPIQKGVSSSTAFIISWILVLSELVEGPQREELQEFFFTKQPILLARLAHRAEVTHFTGAPGGTMDHITIACCRRNNNNNNNNGSSSEDEDGNSRISGPGGIVRIGGRDGDPWHVEYFRMVNKVDNDNNNSNSELNNIKKRKHGDGDDSNDDDMWGVWILADSGQPKDTFGHLHRCKNARLELLDKKLRGDWDYPSGGDEDDHKCEENGGVSNDDEKIEIEKSSKKLTNDERLLWTTTINNRSYEEQAAKIFRRYQDKRTSRTHDDELFDNDDESQYPPGRQLGRLMLQHHEALAGGLNLSTDRIEQMKVAAIRAGAWGFKLVGSGGGGCTVAWGPKSKVSDISSAIRMVAPDEIQTWSIVGTGTGTGPHIARHS